MPAQTHSSGAVEQQPSLWTRGLALSMVAVAGLLVVVVANQIGGVLIAQDLRDQYHELVSDAGGEAAREAAGPRAVGDGAVGRHLAHNAVGGSVRQLDEGRVPALEQRQQLASPVHTGRLR